MVKHMVKVTNEGSIIIGVNMYLDKIRTLSHWRAGASQPSRSTGTIFLYMDLISTALPFQINATRA